MPLLLDLQGHVKDALKSGDAARAGVLRMMVSEIKNKEIEKRTAGGDSVLSDEEIMDVLRKEVKKRRESADLFRQGNRADLAEGEEKEIALIEGYLPAAPTEDDIRKVVSELRAQGIDQFPALMKEAMPRLKGADGAVVSRIVKEG